MSRRFWTYSGLAFVAGTIIGTLGVATWLNWPSWRHAWETGTPPRYYRD